MIVVQLALALAQASAALPAPQAAPTPVKERRICRSGERRLGTRIVTPRRCKTESEWAQEDSRSDPLPVSAQITEGQPLPNQAPRPH